MRLARTLPLLLFVITILCAASLAHAENVQDTQVIPYTLAITGVPGWGYAGSCWATMAPGTQVTVSYNIRAVNADSGAPICGATVPVGTHIALEFLPHVPQDIVWSATGYYAGTPYGSWAQGGDFSQWDSGTKNRCTEPNRYATSINAHGGYFHAYDDLALATPAQDIALAGQGLDCGTPDSNGSLACTAAQAGDTTATFTIHSTFGSFYPGQVETPTASPPKDAECQVKNLPPLRRNGGEISNLNTTVTWGGCYSQSSYQVAVKEKTISCPITVTGPVGNPPATPTLSPAGSCTVGAPQTISMRSTDPDGDQLRYGVDWNADGSIDQWVPASGYVPSGTSQTASRTYAIAGAKTVKVLAQDQNGNSSAWATLTFNCADSATVGLNEGDAGNISADDSAGGGAVQLLPDLDLRVIPSLVKSGNTTRVNWSSENVRSCTVTGQNGDAWSALQSPLGGNISKPITAQTTYTLSCIDAGGTTLTKSATVKIIPTFQEL